MYFCFILHAHFYFTNYTFVTHLITIQILIPNVMN